MSAILLSINPEHVENIFNGTKKYEFRKVRCRKHVTKILIYSTHPVMKIVGEAVVKNVLEHTPNELWNMTSDSSGIDRVFFDNYFEGREKAIAYELVNIMKYECAKELSDIGLSAAPQSFAYVDPAWM